MIEGLFQRYVTAKRLIAFSFLLRITLMLYGELQDRYLNVKYTDIDYHVFSDGARHVTQGNSPFLRDTYRYTPLLAILLSPNIYFFYSFGKVVFVLCDVFCGVLILQILRIRGISDHSSLLCCAIWLLNPITATVSSRGNAEPLITGLILLTIYLLMIKGTVPAAVSYGLAVHMKIYPVIYALPLYLFLNSHYSGKTVPANSTPMQRGFAASPAIHGGRIFNLQLDELLSTDRKLFVMTSVTVFTITTALMYIL